MWFCEYFLLVSGLYFHSNSVSLRVGIFNFNNIQLIFLFSEQIMNLLSYLKPHRQTPGHVDFPF